MNYPAIKQQVSILNNKDLFNNLAYYKAQYEIGVEENTDRNELLKIDATIRALIIEMRSRDLYVN